MFDILATGIFDSRERYKDLIKTPLRTVPCYELEFFLSSSGSAILDGNEIPHRKGLTLFITPETKRQSTGRFSCFYIHFMPDESFKKLIENIKTFSCVNEDFLVDYFLKIIDLYNQTDSDSRLELESTVLELLKLVLFERNTDRKDALLMRKAAEYIEESFSKELDLERIAMRVSLSPTYFHKQFKTFFGVTPREYLTKVRIDHAKRLLLTSDMNFLEISSACGFSSQAYFNCIFKRATGFTPGDFRAKRYNIPE